MTVCFSVTSILLAIFVGLVTYILYGWVKMRRLFAKYNMKGPPIYPIVGTLFSQGKMSMDEAELVCTKKYGRVYSGMVGSFMIIHVSDLEILKKIFVKDFHHFQNRLSVEGGDPWPIYKSLLHLKDEDWKRVRSTVTPTFSAGKLKLMMNELNYCAKSLSDSFEQRAKGEKVVEVRKLFGCYTMDVIAGTAFGMRTESFKHPEEPFVRLAQKVFDQDIQANPFIMLILFFPSLAVLLTKLGFSVFYPIDSIKFFVDVIQRIIEERKKTGDTGRVDLMQLMMNAKSADEDETNKKHLSIDELLGQGFIFFIAGYETTATLLQFAAYALAINPDVQDKLLEEIDSLADVEPSYDNVTELTYLDMFISECLRMYPPICRMNRMVSATEDVEIDGYWFPRKSSIQYSIYQIHHDPENYREPEKFIPERFSPEEKKNRHPLAYLPFGYGPRNCIGMRLALLEAKIALVQVLRRVKFTQCPETDVPLQMKQETFLRLKRPVKVQVDMREQ